MKKLSICSNSAQETIGFAKRLAKVLKTGDVLGFFGNLGSGKTTFIKGIAKGLGLKVKINSPSFVILKIYPRLLYHFDLYRLKYLKELEDIGYEDFIGGNGICVLEWADKAKKLLPKNYLKIKIEIRKQNIRKITFIGYGKRYVELINKIKNN